MTALEEYLQQLYVENYDNIDQKKSEIEGLMGASQTYRHFFYSSQEDFSKGTTDYLSDSEGHALYIVRVANLPKDIREQLVGGTANGLADKFEQDTSNEENKTNLWKACLDKQDVYGVTSDLKVYYCSGKGDFTGVQADALDMDDPGRTVLSDTEDLATVLKTQSINWDTNNDGVISAQEARNVTELKLTSTDLEQLSKKSNYGFTQFYTLPNLSKLYINYDGGTRKEDIDLNGLQNCPKLELVWFYNCTAQDYNYLGKVNKLNSLIFYSINDNDLARICGTDDKGKGINKYDIELKYFGVVGRNEAINNTNVFGVLAAKIDANYIIKDISPLTNLSNITKRSIIYMNLQANSISNLNALENFTGIKLLRCEKNQLKNLNGIENCKNLIWLCACDNNLGQSGTEDKPTPEISESDSISLGKNSIGGIAIKALANNKSIKFMNFRNNPYLANTSWILNCSNMTINDKELGLGAGDFTGCSKTMKIDSFEDTYDNSGKIIKKRNAWDFNRD